MRLPGRKKQAPPQLAAPYPLMPNQVLFIGNVANVDGRGAYLNHYEYAPEPELPKCHQCGTEMPPGPDNPHFVATGLIYSRLEPPQDAGTGYTITVSSGQVYLQQIFCRWECVEEWLREKAPGELVGQRLAKA